MKKVSILMMITALLFASCANDGDSDSASLVIPNTNGTTQNPVTPSDDSTSKTGQTKSEGKEKTNTSEKNKSADNFVLDFSVTTSYSMKVGETVEIQKYFNDFNGEHDIFISNINDISDYVENSNADNGNILLTAKSVGTITVKTNDRSDVGSDGIAKGAKTWYCIITITADGFSGNSIEYKLLGTWRYKDSSSYGTIIFNRDMTGHIYVTLNSTIVHDNDFTWKATEYKNGSRTIMYFTLSGTGVSALDSGHPITELRSNRFTIDEYLAFGMPKLTTWYKQ